MGGNLKRYSFIDTGLKPFPKDREIAQYVRECFLKEISVFCGIRFFDYYVRVDTLAGANFALCVDRAKKSYPGIVLHGISSYPDFLSIYSKSDRHCIKNAITACDHHRQYSSSFNKKIHEATNAYVAAFSDTITDYAQMQFSYRRDTDDSYMLF